MKRLLIFIFIIIFLLGGLSFWWRNGKSAVNPVDKSQKIFVIYKGQGIREISGNLKKEGLIKDQVVFFLLVKKLGLDSNIQAGDFRLSPSMTAVEIAENLTHGTLDIWVTIPEGKRAEEIAEILARNISAYQNTWRKILIGNEGYLFPDTYLIPKDADIDLIVSLMKNNFDKKYEGIAPVKKTNLTRGEIVILASMIEREAKFAEDRPLVASVLLNRKNIGMKLDIDATIQYALGYQEDQKTWWKKGLTPQDIKLNSSYNTYLNPGLPPTPISNPGLQALNAVVNPAETEYLYYISDQSGHNHYAKTIEEHNANIKTFGL